jgi:Putative phage serine protease XkdF
MGLPIYELLIDDNQDSTQAMNGIALVKNPAYKAPEGIGNFQAFSEQAELKFANVDMVRGIVSGLLIEADKPIYRNDNQLGEYQVIVTAEQSYKLVQKFFQLGFNQNFNLNHDPAEKVQDVVLFECFISDKTRGVMPMQGFENVPDGSVFVSCQINNEDVKAKIKSGEITGFSMEGFFGMARVSEVPLTKDEFSFLNKHK